jgi:hypothetical protein
MKALLFLLISVFSLNAQARECIPQTEMQEIAQHFSQFRDLANSEYCNDNSHRYHLVAGIMFMRKTQFDESMQRSRDDLFSGRFASSWYTYFIGRINRIEIDTNCPKGVAAYVYAWGGRTMYACTMMLSENYTALDRASVFMHEARHIDGYPHMTCRSGPRAGLRGACDNRISDGGSYAVTVETYAQLARYAQDVHPALRAYARSSAVIYADETFQQEVRVDRTRQFLVMADDKSFHQVKVDGSLERLGESPALGRIVMRSQHMILFPEDKTLRARFLFAGNEGEINQEAGNQAVEYNGLSPEERAKWTDLHIGAQWNAVVFQDKVRFSCDPNSHATRELPLSGERPVGLLYPEGYDRAAWATHLMMESGKVFDVSCTGKSAALRPSALVLDRTYKAVHRVGELTLGLTTDGFLREIQGASSRPFSLGALDGRIRALAPNQSFSFFDEHGHQH